MAETESPTSGTPENGDHAGPARSADEIALELMKFIAVTTGCGKASQASAGFSGKPHTHSSEEQIETLLELFDRCRRTVRKEL